MDEDFHLRHFYAQIGNLIAQDRYGDGSGADILTVGKNSSTFSDEHAQPQTLINNAAPAGAILRRPDVLARYRFVLRRGWSTAIAIEKPETADFALVNTNDQRLQRWPDFVWQLRFQRPANGTTHRAIESLQVAMLLRGMGLEDTNFMEQSVAGWGISVASRLQTWQQDNLRVGVAAGEGIGSYLLGFTTDQSAAPSGGQLTALSAVGTYAAYQRVWSEGLRSTVAYGYAMTDTTPDMPRTAARKSQNAWANLVWIVHSNLAIGTECHYGLREVKDGTRGDNLRVFLTVEVKGRTPTGGF